MNYFTPERLVRLQDHSDEKQFLAELDDWEQALKGYRRQLEEIQQRLRAIQPQFPKHLHKFFRFLDTISLHDARILVMSWGGERHFRIALHTEFQPERLVVLTYSLREPPQIQANVLPEQFRSEPISWLYDEVTLDDRTRKGKPVLRHSILLSDGREVGLCFYYVTIELSISLVPVLAAGRECDCI